MMGCGSSVDTRSINDDYSTNGYMSWPANLDDATNIVQEFGMLDEKIVNEEANCWAARANTVESWIAHLTQGRNELIGLRQTLVKEFPATQTKSDYGVEIEELPTTPMYVAKTNTPISTSTLAMSNTPTKDLVSLALNLGVLTDVKKASTHEDFFAQLSEAALQQAQLKYYTEIIAHTNERLTMLTTKQKSLNELYLKHDGIIAYISGGTYMTEFEQQIDADLETAREIRDKLGATLEQWRICGTLLRTSSTSATHGLQQWRNLPNLSIPQEKMRALLECHEIFAASVVSLECAQQCLPQTDFKYITNRQLLAVKHCTTYMITDIVNSLRYEHASRVFASYEDNLQKCLIWIFDTFSKTLRKDFDEAQLTVNELAKKLREHRLTIFKTARQ